MWQEWTPAAVCSPHDLFLWDGNFKLSSPSSCRHKKQSVLCVFLGITEGCFGISLFSACEWKGPFYRLQFRHTPHLVGFHAFCTAYVEKDFSQPGCINLPGSFFFGRHMVSFRCLLPLYYDLNGIRRFSYLHLPMMSSSDIDTCKCHARTFAVVLLQIPRANFFFLSLLKAPQTPPPLLGKCVKSWKRCYQREKNRWERKRWKHPDSSLLFCSCESRCWNCYLPYRDN